MAAVSLFTPVFDTFPLDARWPNGAEVGQDDRCRCPFESRPAAPSRRIWSNNFGTEPRNRSVACRMQTRWGENPAQVTSQRLRTFGSFWLWPTNDLDIATRLSVDSERRTAGPTRRCRNTGWGPIPSLEEPNEASATASGGRGRGRPDGRCQRSVAKPGPRRGGTRPVEARCCRETVRRLTRTEADTGRIPPEQTDSPRRTRRS